MLLNGAGVNLSLQLTELGLKLDEPGVFVVVAFDLSLQAPVAILADFFNDVGVWGRIGSDALKEPGGNDVRGGFTGNGWLSVELMEIDVVVVPPQRALSESHAWEVPHIVGLEVDIVDLDEEVRDVSCVFFKAVGALLLNTVVVTIFLELGKAGSHSFEGGISGGEGHLLSSEGMLVVALHVLEVEFGVVGLVDGHLGNLFCKNVSHFRG